MKRLRNLIASLLVAVSIIALNPIGASAKWEDDSTGRWYSEGNSWLPDGDILMQICTILMRMDI